MDSGMNFIKTIFFLFNLIFALSGIVSIAIGSCIIGSVKGFKFFTDSRITVLPIALIVAGVIVFIVAFLGFFGAIKENYTLLMAFTAALVVIFIVELAIGITSAVFKNNFEVAMRNTMRKSMYVVAREEHKAWEEIHRTFTCCGIDGPSDWAQPTIKRGLSAEYLPNTCCQNPSVVCRASPGPYSPYMHGCWASVASKMKASTSMLIGVGIGIAIIDIIGITFACLLAMTIKKENEAK